MIQRLIKASIALAGVLMLGYNVLAETVLLSSAEPSVTPPAVVTAKAAYWADMSETSVVSADAGNTLSQWRDARETAAANATPSLYYAVPAWTNGGETAAVSTEFLGVNPAIRTIGDAARKAIDFHGRSGIYLRLKKANNDGRIDGVRHFFAVHNPTNWFGSLIGFKSANRHGALFLYPEDNSYVYKMGGRYPLYWFRTDLNAENGSASLGMLAQSADISVDGVRIDPFSYFPHVGWQLFDTAYPDASLYARFETVFFQRYEGGQTADGHRAGGNFISELIVFTNQLSQAEVASIRSYLDAKWGLPTWRDPEALNEIDYLVPPQVVTNVALDGETTATVAVGAGEVSRSFSLSGDGTVDKQGEGALVIGASQNLEPFGGLFNLNAGNVYLRGGTPPPLFVTGGTALSSEDFVAGTSGSASAEGTREQAAGAVRIAMSTVGNGGTFTKTGPSPAAVSGFDTSVANVVVEGGELTIGKPEDVGCRGEVTIENGDFEAPYHCPAGDGNYTWWAYNLCPIPKNSFSNGWRRIDGSGNGGACFQRVGRGCTFADGSLVENAETSDGRKWVGSSAYGLNMSVGAGNQIVNFSQCKIYTSVKLPTAGCYELSFDLSSRYSEASKMRNAPPVAVRFGSNTSDWPIISYAQGTAGHWTHVKVLLPHHSAGEAVIGFDSDIVQVNCATFIDNIRLRFVSKDARDTYAIPNGDFEQLDVTAYKPDPQDSSTWYWSNNFFSLTNRAVNWTFAPTTLTSDGLNAYVGLVNPNIGMRYSSSWAPRLWGANLNGFDTHGVTALLLAGPSPSATTTFTPPAGTWRLRHRLQTAHLYVNSNLNFRASNASTVATCDASVNIGGNATTLGRISATKQGRFERYDYPTTFTTDGATPVTLTLSTPDNTTIAALVDDLELVGETSVADMTGELVVNGDFESGSQSWATYEPYMPEDAVKRPSSGVEFRKYLDGTSSHSYGTLQYSGTKAALFKNHCGIMQDVVFPAAGRYRLRFALRSRVDSAEYGNGYFGVKLWQGSVTNRIAYFQYPYQCNFTERTYLFEVPSAGTYTLGMEGYGPMTREHETTCYVDGISICFVDWSLPETISLDSKAAIDLLPGDCASLNLAFTGTNTVGVVQYDGKPIGKKIDGNVIVNRETCPLLVSGPGTFTYKSLGLMIFVR